MKKLLCTVFMICSLSSVALFAAKEKVTAKEVYESDGSSLKEFFTGSKKYIEFDDVKLRTSTVLDSLKAREATLIYNPRSKAAGVSTYFETMFYNFLFDEEARNLIQKGFEQYKKDFEEKSLIRKASSKTTKMYGSAKVYAEFGTIKTMMSHYANSVFNVGYRFYKNTPFFVLSIESAKDEWSDAEEETRWVMPTVTLYFTLAQGELFSTDMSTDVLKIYQDEFDQFVNSDLDEEKNENKKYNKKDDDLDIY